MIYLKLYLFATFSKVSAELSNETSRVEVIRPTTEADKSWQSWYYQSYHPGGHQQSGDSNLGPWSGHTEGLGAEEVHHPWMVEWYNSSSGGSGYYNSTFGGHLFGLGGQDSGHLYQAIIQGVLVCLFTTVGGVMLLVFCLIIVQECKVVTSVLYKMLNYSIFTS